MWHCKWKQCQLVHFAFLDFLRNCLKASFLCYVALLDSCLWLVCAEFVRVFVVVSLPFSLKFISRLQAPLEFIFSVII